MADPLTGKLFHTFQNDDLVRQGQIRSRVRDHYLVQYFSWSDGGETTQELVALDAMTGWKFYDDPDEWRAAARSRQATGRRRRE